MYHENTVDNLNEEQGGNAFEGDPLLKAVKYNHLIGRKESMSKIMRNNNTRISSHGSIEYCERNNVLFWRRRLGEFYEFGD